MRTIALLLPLVLCAGPGEASPRCFPHQRAVRSADGVIAVRGRSVCVASGGGVTVERFEADRIGKAVAIHRVGDRFLVASRDARRGELLVAAFAVEGGRARPACGFFSRDLYGVTDHGSMAVWIDRGRIEVTSNAAGAAITARPSGAAPVTVSIQPAPAHPPAPCIGTLAGGDLPGFEKAARAIESP